MAPLVASLLKFGFSVLAPVVAAKGKEVVEEKLGVDLDKMLGTEEGRIQLRRMEMENEQFFAAMAERSEIRDLDYFKSEVADKDSARKRDMEFLKAGLVNWRANIMFVIAVCVICWLVWIIWKSVELNEYVKGIFTLVLGRFLGYLDNIYNFEFGTTRASRQKDTTIEKLSEGSKQ